jgi:ankyrin repeat protein
MSNDMLILLIILAVYLIAVLIIYPYKLFKTKSRWVSWILLIWIGVMAASLFNLDISSAISKWIQEYFYIPPQITIDEYGVKNIHSTDTIISNLFNRRLAMILFLLGVYFLLNLVLIFPVTYFMKRKQGWIRPLILSIIPTVLLISYFSYLDFEFSSLKQLILGKPEGRLIAATDMGNKTIVKYLISHGYDVNHRNSNQNDSLFFAIRNNDVSMVRLLLQYSLNSSNKNAGLHEAVGFHKDTAIVMMLVEKGADIKSIVAGKSLLMNTFNREDKPLVEFLVNHGVDLQARDTLVKGSWPFFKNGGKTALHYIAYDSHPAILEYMLKQAPELINAQDDAGNTPLMDNLDSYKLPQNAIMLINQGADINLCNKEGASPLYWALYEGKFDIASTLFDKGAYWKVTTKKGISITEEVLSHCSTDFIEYYLKKTGYGINQKDKNGKTPLFYAIEGRNLEAVKYLIAHGANAKIKDKKGKGLLSFDDECWNEKDRREMLRILGEAGATY